ncbi:MAG: ribonuclease HII [Pseudomonadales bacterium]|nr:ribonuclease HII [Pseudomonadales bacterium]MDG1442144.1 ribonuclease HII [Pseudomonadales bacterium]
MARNSKYRKDRIAGVDEVGRGPLAGAVLAAAVILDPANPIEGLKDSKALTEKRRIVLDEEIRQRAIAYCVARAEVHEIDAINILHASMLAMQRAVAGLSVKPEYAIVDGNRSPAFECPSDWLIKGDTKHDSIKAASIIAKVARDHEMIELDAVFPQYGFAQHKGYPTRMHLSALSKFGPTEIHRMSFRPCREALKQNE